MEAFTLDAQTCPNLEQFDQFLDGVNKRTYQPKVLWPYIFPDHKEFLALIVHLRYASTDNCHFLHQSILARSCPALSLSASVRFEDAVFVRLPNCPSIEMPESGNLLGMMLEQAKHEVFSDTEILDETVMFYAVCADSPSIVQKT